MSAILFLSAVNSATLLRAKVANQTAEKALFWTRVYANTYYLYVLDAITPLDRVSEDVTTYPYHIGKVLFWCNRIEASQG